MMLDTPLHLDNNNDLFIVARTLYGAVLFLGVKNCSTVQPVIAIERIVFYREKAAGMYSAVMLWLRFFRQFLVIFLVHQMASSLFRLMAGIFRTMILANSRGFIALLLIFMGFILPRENIPKWWIWGYWCSPLMYAENAISVNDMLAPRWMISAENTTNLGVSDLKSRNIFPQEYWYWLGVAALLGFSVLFNVLFTLAKSLGKPQAVIFEE